jgi:serine protease Do
LNPGNSGGPIIDEKGYVHGVATRGLPNSEGMGFAIPIEKVFEEFQSILH